MHAQTSITVQHRAPLSRLCHSDPTWQIITCFWSRARFPSSISPMQRCLLRYYCRPTDRRTRLQAAAITTSSRRLRSAATTRPIHTDHVQDERDATSVSSCSKTCATRLPPPEGGKFHPTISRGMLFRSSHHLHKVVLKRHHQVIRK
jgi:hypothetical protein